MRGNWPTILIVAVFACAADAKTPTTAPSALPRYHLTLGQELTFVNVSAIKYQNVSASSGSTNVYDVVGINPDGGWRVIGRLASWYKMGDRSPEPSTEMITFDLRPDGGVTMLANGSWEPSAPPTDFPALPVDRAQIDGGWQRDMGDGGRVNYKSLPATRPNTVSFTSDVQNIESKVYLMTDQNTYTFDASRGLLTSAAGTDSQGYGFIGKGGGLTILASDTHQPRQWLEQYAHDCDLFFAAQKQSGDLLDKAEADPAQVDSAVAAAKNVLTDARGKITVAQIADLLDKKISEVANEGPELKQDATERQAVLDKPAPAWTLTDLAGGKHSLDEYRGKVVVLDFWYRGCGWCMKAMPQVKQLAADFAGKPVVVLGMNTDRDPADAKFVVGVFGLDYPILHVENDLVKQYHIQGFPTTFLIGPDGILRDMEVGYSPTLHDELSRKITGLLPTK